MIKWVGRSFKQGSQSDVLVILSTFNLFSFHLFIFHIVILWACQHTHLGVCELVSMGQEDLHKRAVHQQMENLSYYSVLNSKGVLIMCLDLEQQYTTCSIVICYFALTGWDFLLKRLKEFGNHGIPLLNLWTKSAKLKDFISQSCSWECSSFETNHVNEKSNLHSCPFSPY